MKWKLSLLFLLVILLPFVVALQLIATIVEQGMNKSLVERVDASAELAVKLVDRSFTRLGKWASAIARSPRIKNAVASGDDMELFDRLEELRREYNLFGGVIEVMTVDGNLLAVVPKRQGNELHADGDAIARAWAGEMPLTIRRDGPSIKVTTAQPIYHEKSAKPIAAIALSFETNDAFADQIKNLVKTNIIIFDDVDKRCRVLASTIFSGAQRARPAIPLQQAHRTIIKIDGTPYCLRSRPVMMADGTFFVAVLHDRRTLEATLRSVRTTLMAIGLVAATLALFAAGVFSRKVVVNPINTLVKGAQQLGDGNFDKELSLDTGDEFAFLATTFDDMRLRIKKTLEALDKKVYELSLMDEINRAIIKHSGRTLLSQVLEVVAKALEAEHASIMMVVESKNEDKKALELKQVYVKAGLASEGLTVKEYIQLSLGEGLAGRAASEGKSQFSNDIQSDNRFKRYTDGKMDESMRNLLCVPLMGDKEVLGVINVSNCAKDIEEGAAQLVQLVADQVAIALLKARLYEEAITDGMTGLFIHKYFQARLETEIQRARRYDGRLSLVMFDIDFFKTFNDTFGHQVGDEVIIMVADVIRENHREGIDIAARYGGEEFAIIVPRSRCGKGWRSGERPSSISRAIGHRPQGRKSERHSQSWLCRISSSCLDGSRVNHCADAALYKSKEGGRNRVTLCNQQSRSEIKGMETRWSENQDTMSRPTKCTPRGTTTRSIVPLMVFLVIGLTFWSGCFKPRWVEFDCSEGGYKVSMPQQPERMPRVVKTAIGPVEVIFFNKLYNKVSFISGYVDYPKQYVKGTTADSILSGARDGGGVADAEGELEDEKRITQGDYPGREITMKSKDGKQRMHSRIFLAGQRFYQAMIIVPVDGEFKDDVDRYLNSFVITQKHVNIAGEKAPWSEYKSTAGSS